MCRLFNPAIMWSIFGIFCYGQSFADDVTVAWTLLPDSSGVWQTDPYFGAQSNNPLSILSNASESPGESVDFIGYEHTGGSTDTLSGAHLVYRWLLTFSAPVEINSITMDGFGDQSGATDQMRLLDDNLNLLSTKTLTGYNTLATNVLGGSSEVGTTFYYDEYDQSTDGRYRSYLTVSYTPVPLPSTLILIASGLAGLIGFRRKLPLPSDLRSCI